MCLAIPGKLTEIYPEEMDHFQRSGKVLFGGISQSVNLSLVPEAKVGDYILVHVGVALSVVDEEEAKKTKEYLDKMDKEGGK